MTRAGQVDGNDAIERLNQAWLNDQFLAPFDSGIDLVNGEIVSSGEPADGDAPRYLIIICHMTQILERFGV